MKQEKAFIIIILILLSVLAINNLNLESLKKTEVNISFPFISVNKSFITNVTKSEANIFVPAVDNQGNGVAVKLTVEALPGEGRILVNIDKILFWVDTQQSMRIARDVAQKITNKDLSKIDLIYTIETEANVVEGPSAGAALTIATIAALENKSINTSVMITGTINPDGTIGPVGGIVPKSKAAKDIGAKLFLIPEGQGEQVNYKPKEECKTIGFFTYCKIEYIPEKITVSKISGIEVREVSNINDALKYFLS
jgi:uncharacterized protein